MNWQELTADGFSASVSATGGVCLLPLSCLESHADHLPLGTDVFIARALCERAASIEPAIVFPDLIFTQILEAQHCAGAVAVDPELILRLLDNVCREIARNGLKKIVLVNAHGGNKHFLHYFVQCQLTSPRDYVVYLAEPRLPAAEAGDIRDQWTTTVDGHAGENETSQMLAIRPQLVNAAAMRDDDEGMPHGRLRALRDAGLYTALWWFADHPTHFRGDPRPATREKGERFLRARAEALAESIRVVKNDVTTPALQRDFFARSGRARPES